MNLYFAMITCLLSFFCSNLFTWLTRIYALKKSILDVPNERSSHQIPTPRGGGAAVALTFNCFILGLLITGFIDSNLGYVLLGGGTVVALIGYCDDIYSIKAYQRFLLHFLAAIWAIYWLNGFSFLIHPTNDLFNWVSLLLTAIYITWCINFYNFMDGIDGIAGSEGIFIGLANGIVLYLLGSYHLALIMFLLTAAISGFTVWNWPPAKIFLGDVGSGFLGYVFAVFSLYTINQKYLSVSFWLIILSIFACDATLTLLYRIYQGKRWYAAHREHAYQLLISLGASHRYVTTSISIINFCILLPLAFAAIYYPAYSFWLAASAISGLGITWLLINLRHNRMHSS